MQSALERRMIHGTWQSLGGFDRKNVFHMEGSTRAQHALNSTGKCCARCSACCLKKRPFTALMFTGNVVC